MIPHQIVAQLKERYGQVFFTSDGRNDYAFRPLTIKEFNALANEESSVDAEDFAVMHALVYPENIDLDDMKPGTVSSIAEEILTQSAFTDPKVAKHIFEEKRQLAEDVVNVMKAVVLACYEELRLTEEDVLQLTFAQLSEKVALAEQIIQIRKSIHDPSIELKLEIIDPEEQMEVDKRAQQEEMDKILHSKDPDTKSTFGTARADDPIAKRLHDALRG